MANTQVYGIPLTSTRELYRNRGQIPFSRSGTYVRQGDCDNLNVYVCSRFADETLVTPVQTAADVTAALGEYHQVTATAGTPLTITLPVGTAAGDSVVIQQSGTEPFSVVDNGGTAVFTVPNTPNTLYRFAWNGSAWVVS